MQSYDLILKNAYVLVPIDPNQNPSPLKSELLDIGIKDGKISALGSLAHVHAQKVLDCKNLHVAPGLIDSQVHFRDPGMDHKEDFYTGTKAAVFGGITTVFDMPNTKPSTTTLELLNEKFKIISPKAHCHFALYGGASTDNVSELSKMENHPHCSGIKIFMGSSTGNLLVDNPTILEEVFLTTKRRLVIHSEDEARMNERKHIAINGKHAKYHPIWRDEESALISTKKLIAVAQKTNRQVHVLHISSLQELEFLKDYTHIATCEALPNHLTLSTPECYERLGNLAQQNPPIRDQKHQDALWRAVQNNIIKVIGSDHAPHTLEEKNREYPDSPSGTPGVQTTLPIMLNHVNNNKLSLEHFVAMMTENPRSIFKIKNKGRIQIGYDADFTIFDINKSNTITNNWIKSKSQWTPFDQMKVKGWPFATIIDGQIILQEDTLIESNPTGKPISFY